MIETFITACDNVKCHILELDATQDVYQIGFMADDPEYPYADQGKRLRWLRQAERINTASAFAEKFKWPQSGMSQFETGKRRVPMDKVLQLRAQILGFDPLWLWEGDKRGLSFELRQRIEAEEAKEKASLSASGER